MHVNGTPDSSSHHIDEKLPEGISTSVSLSFPIRDAKLPIFMDLKTCFGMSRISKSNLDGLPGLTFLANFPPSLGSMNRKLESNLCLASFTLCSAKFSNVQLNSNSTFFHFCYEPAPAAAARVSNFFSEATGKDPFPLPKVMLR